MSELKNGWREWPNDDNDAKYPLDETPVLILERYATGEEYNVGQISLRGGTMGPSGAKAWRPILGPHDPDPVAERITRLESDVLRYKEVAENRQSLMESAIAECDKAAEALKLAEEELERLVSSNEAGVGRPYHGNEALGGDVGAFYVAYNKGIDTCREFFVRKLNPALVAIRALRGAK